MNEWIQIVNVKLFVAPFNLLLQERLHLVFLYVCSEFHWLTNVFHISRDCALSSKSTAHLKSSLTGFTQKRSKNRQSLRQTKAVTKTWSVSRTRSLLSSTTPLHQTNTTDVKLTPKRRIKYLLPKSRRSCSLPRAAFPTRTELRVPWRLPPPRRPSSSGSSLWSSETGQHRRLFTLHWTCSSRGRAAEVKADLRGLPRNPEKSFRMRELICGGTGAGRGSRNSGWRSAAAVKLKRNCNLYHCAAKIKDAKGWFFFVDNLLWNFLLTLLIR